MTIRKCIYTGRKAGAKDNVLPKYRVGDEIHNWANNVPCSTSYKTYKKDNMPTELEMEANELFHLIELSKLRTKFYEEKLAEIQKVLDKECTVDEITEEDIRNKQIDKAYKEKEQLEKFEEITKQALEDRKGMWD